MFDEFSWKFEPISGQLEFGDDPIPYSLNETTAVALPNSFYHPSDCCCYSLNWLVLVAVCCCCQQFYWGGGVCLWSASLPCGAVLSVSHCSSAKKVSNLSSVVNEWHCSSHWCFLATFLRIMDGLVICWYDSEQYNWLSINAVLIVVAIFVGTLHGNWWQRSLLLLRLDVVYIDIYLS